MSRWTNGLYKATLHRVVNPARTATPASNSRRLSMAFFHKPAYDAAVEVLPTCYSGSSSAAAGGAGASACAREVLGLPEAVALPAAPLFAPAVVGDLTRQGILHKFRHLPQEQASAKYHELLASMRATG
jgi:hypothetical protein